MTRQLRRRPFLLGLLSLTWATTARSAAQEELHALLPSARALGSTRFSSWGFAIYDARLWVLPGFDADSYDQHGFALELRYLRDFSNASITSRSIAEIRRQADVAPERLTLWQQALGGAFPDVRKGDRILGLHRPGEGAIFLTNGQRTGAIEDTEFARLFFGIWLSDKTSEPALRAALLGRGLSR